MIFLAVLAAATAVSAGVQRHASPRTWLRTGAGAAFVVAGVSHFAQPTPFEQHFPDWVPAPTAVVDASGIAEIALGAALLRLPNRRLAGRAAAAFLIAVWPANVYVAVSDVDVDGQPGGVYPWLRLPLQALFVWWVLWSTDTADSSQSPAPNRPVRTERRHAHG